MCSAVTYYCCAAACIQHAQHHTRRTRIRSICQALGRRVLGAICQYLNCVRSMNRLIGHQHFGQPNTEYITAVAFVVFLLNPVLSAPISLHFSSFPTEGDLVQAVLLAAPLVGRYIYINYCCNRCVDAALWCNRVITAGHYYRCHRCFKI